MEVLVEVMIVLLETTKIVDLEASVEVLEVVSPVRVIGFVLVALTRILLGVTNVTAAKNRKLMMLVVLPAEVAEDLNSAVASKVEIIVREEVSTEVVVDLTEEAQCVDLVDLIVRRVEIVKDHTKIFAPINNT